MAERKLLSELLPRVYEEARAGGAGLGAGPRLDGGAVEGDVLHAIQMHLDSKADQDSVERIQQARDSFDKIRGSVDSIRDQNTQIATAAEEQHQVAEEINRHIAQIHADAQLVEGFAHSAQTGSGRLTDISGQLNGLVGRFKF